MAGDFFANIILERAQPSFIYARYHIVQRIFWLKLISATGFEDTEAGSSVSIGVVKEEKKEVG